MLVAFSGAAWSLSSNLNLQQLNHRSYTYLDGAPSSIYALAQTMDGTLWIGSGSGLSRFDGLRFRPYPGPFEQPLASTTVTSLAPTADGGLWVGYGDGGVSFLKDNKVENFRPGNGLPDDTVFQFARDLEGSLWAATFNGLARFNGQRWETVGDDSGLPSTVIGVLVDRQGALWAATSSGLFVREPARARFRLVDSRPFDYGSSNPILALSPNGTVWAANPRELLMIKRRTGAATADVVTVRGASGGPLLIDREGNVWGAQANPNVVTRVSGDDLTDRDKKLLPIRPETFSRVQGATDGNVSALLEDREGNIWVGSSLGLERFTHSNVLREESFCQSPTVATGDGGTLWIVCPPDVPMQAAELLEWRGGVIVGRQRTPTFTVGYRDHEGVIWFGGESSLGRLERGKLEIIPLPASFLGRFVHALARDVAGTLWVFVYGKGYLHFSNGKWTEGASVNGLPKDVTVGAAISDESGAVWLAYPDNRIARVRDDQVDVFDSHSGLDLGSVKSLLEHDGEVWAGGERGLARLVGGRFVQIQTEAMRPLKEISGIVRARDGDLWVNGMNGIARLPRAELDRAAADPAYQVEIEIFDRLDGVPGPAILYGSRPTAFLGSDFRLWFVMTGGIVSVDPAGIARNAMPPPVKIWSLSSGSTRYSVAEAAVELPKRTTNVRIEYGAGSFMLPERVQFRYRLQGLDRNWQEAGSRREAQYTNLPPGSYVFRVVAANNDGIWNDAGASMAFTIPPAYYQTRWFYLLCAFACAALLVALYRVRMRQVASHVRSRLEARLSERERIARELHDTLLQGMQGLIWRFQAATERIKPGEPARAMLEESLDRADRLLEESRDKVKELRPVASGDLDLAQAFATLGAELAETHPIAFRVSEQGNRRDLHPIAREEVYLVGREALGNAFRHSGASNIEIELTFDDSALQVRIRDDGQGIVAEVLAAGGKPGHFGLIGMRERAKRLGAHVQFWTKPGAGTEVDMRVPAEVAYQGPAKHLDGKRSWLATFRSP